jgi:hypothetical protein
MQSLMRVIDTRVVAHLTLFCLRLSGRRKRPQARQSLLCSDTVMSIHIFLHATVCLPRGQALPETNFCASMYAYIMQYAIRHTWSL